MSSLRSFIKAVRAAKTVADERAVIQKESAAIRTSFRDDFQNDIIRRHNVAKLLYLYTLGERTHFGQIECLKLLATAKFSDKRLGYLATMLLLDENQEVLTLLTNSLSNDLSHPNQYIAALALCTLANIASTEMARDLATDVEKILSCSNPYLKKKAALCAMRIINRVPELEELYIDKAKMLVSNSNSGVVLCGCALITDMCLQNPALVDEFKPLVPNLLNRLNSLHSTNGFTVDNSVDGISDPFLIAKALRLIRILAADDDSSSSKLASYLAFLSSWEGTQNVRHAVSYEAVLTIFGTNSDSGLRVLGVNVLGQFLSYKNNNTRYVALNTLLKVVDIEPTAVQRHRATIIECLQDSDISIRRRALELSYSLINEQNIRVMARELLTFLETADAEFKTSVVSQVALAAERFAPNKRWHIDTIIRALKLAGSFAKENVLSSFITLVISADDLHLYAVQKLYAALLKDASQDGLTLVSVWLLGEYGDVLLQDGTYKDDSGGANDESSATKHVTESDLVDLLETILSGSYGNETVGEYVVNALMKLSVRITSPSQIERIRRILESKTRTLDVELQQRVVEYLKLFNHDSVRRGVLEKIPAPELREDLSKQAEKVKVKSRQAGGARVRTVTPKPANDVDLLLDLASDSLVTPASGADGAAGSGATNGPSSSDLLSDIFGTSNSVSTGQTTQSHSQPQNQNQNILDLFGGSTTTSAASNTVGLSSSAPKTAPTTTTNSALDDLFGGSTQSKVSAPASVSPSNSVDAFNKNSLLLKLSYTQAGPGVVNIVAQFENTSMSSNIANLTLQVAVPKSQKLALQTISSSSLGPGSKATQNMKVTGPAGGSVKLRMRLAYVLDGSEVKEQVDFNKFPAGIL